MKLQEIENYETLATKLDLERLRSEIHKEFGDFKAELFKTLWLTQLSTIGLILIRVRLLIHYKPSKL